MASQIVSTNMFDITITKQCEKTYLITGESAKQYKEVLKAMGATCKKTLNAWVIGVDRYTALGGELGILSYLSETDPATFTAPNITVTKYNDKSYLIKGEPCKKYKEVLKAMGATRTASLKAWKIENKLYTALGGEVGILKKLSETDPATFKAPAKVQKSKPRGDGYPQDYEVEILSNFSNVSCYKCNNWDGPYTDIPKHIQECPMWQKEAVRV